MDTEARLMKIGEDIFKEYEMHSALFKSLRLKCPYITSYKKSDDIAACKHEAAYAKHPSDTYKWCDYNVCPLITEGM